MTDSRPKKTLTLKRARTQTISDRSDSARKRSGARARQVAHLERQRQREQDAAQNTAQDTTQDAGQDTGRASRADRDRGARHQEGAPRGRPDAQAGPARARPSRPRPDRPGRPHSRPNKTGTGRRQPAHGARTDMWPVFAPCPAGLEKALEAELITLGYEAVKAGRAGCHFQSDWDGVMRANLYSRLATRILVQVAHAPVRTEDDILELARATAWEQWFGPEHSLRLDTSAVRSPMKSLDYCNLRAKDGICDRLREREGARPDIDTVRPDARVHLFLDADSATLYLDTSGEALFKRGWRLDKGSAPLRENLAAGLLALSGWQPTQPLLDPFCGSATILIEAAWMALNIPPGLARPFGFERMRTHRRQHWRAVRDAARENILPASECILFGSDTDAAALDAARQNMARARLDPGMIRLEQIDARQVQPPAETGWIVCNPPYGERLDATDQAFWQDWSTTLKQHYAGWSVHVISSNLELPSHLRLKPRRRRPVYNGALECRLFSFDMVSDSYRP